MTLAEDGAPADPEPLARYRLAGGRAARSGPLRRWLGWGLRAAAVLFSVWPLLGNRLATGHFAEFHVLRTILVGDLWRTGHLVPRWVPELAGGFGSPLFIYYGWLPYAVAGVPHFLGLDATLAMNLTLVAAAFAQATGAWFLGKELGGRRGAWIAWALASFAPYQLVNLYVRVNFPEYFAGALAPLALWLVVRALRTRQRHDTALAAAVLAALALAHNLTAATTVPVVLVAGAGLALLRRDQPRSRALGRVAAIAGLAGLLSAFFTVPVLLGRDEVQLDRIFSGYYDHALHFVYPSQLFETAWKYGYSLPGPADGMPFQLGRGQWLALAAGVVAMFLRRGRRTAARRCLPVLFVAALGLVFMTTTWSAQLWTWVGPLRVIHFPWLLFLPADLLITAIGAIAAGVLLVWRPARHPGVREAGRFLPGALALGIAAFSVHYCRPAGLVRSEESSYRSALRNLYVTTASRDEFMPAWVMNQVALSRCNRDFAALDGVAQVRMPEPIMRDEFALRLRAPAPGELLLPVFFFRGWNVEMDGAAAPVYPCRPTGLLCVRIDAGEHGISGRWRPTARFRITEGMSALAALALVLWVAASRRRAPSKISKRRCG
jgi:hypothetical protein